MLLIEEQSSYHYERYYNITADYLFDFSQIESEPFAE